jgi:tripartite-type tricarboxylate transporter receptor subunit TctC
MPRIGHLIGRRGTLLGAPALLATAGIRPAGAQAWPGRQVRIVVGFAAGGANDIMARLIAGKLGERIPGTAFVVENRPGAGTLLAAENVARSAPDGGSFLYASTSTLITLLVNRGTGLDPVRDFATVTMAQSSPLLMVSRPDFPAKTLPELLALARQRPVTVSHPGTGGINHLAMALLTQRTGVDFTLVPYTGNQPSLTALVRGDVDVAHDSFFATKGLLANNSIRPIAVTSAGPAAAMPAVPTVAATVPGYEVLFWGGMMAPRGVPEPILDRMAAEVDAILHLPEVMERVTSFGADPVGLGRAHYAKTIAEDWARWGAVVREIGLKGD